MNYYIARNNQQLGVFSREDFLARYNRGEFLPSDLVWTEGMAAWQSAAQIFGAPVPPAPDAVAPPLPPVAVPVASAEPCPPDHRTLAIVATVLSVITISLISLVLGIIAIYLSTQVGTKYRLGDLEGAKSAARTSKILSWIAIGILILAFIVVVAIGLSFNAGWNVGYRNFH